MSSDIDKALNFKKTANETNDTGRPLCDRMSQERATGDAMRKDWDNMRAG